MIACILARKTAEVVLMLDPSAGTDLRRLHVLKSVWPTFARAVYEEGCDSLIVPLEPNLETMNKGLVLSRYGFKSDPRMHLTFDLVHRFQKEL